MQRNLVVQSQLNVCYLLESEALSDSWVNNSYELVWINLTYTALNELDKCLLNKHLTPSLSCKLSLLYTWTKFVFLMFVKLKFKIFIDLLLIWGCLLHEMLCCFSVGQVSFTSPICQISQSWVKPHCRLFSSCHGQLVPAYGVQVILPPPCAAWVPTTHVRLVWW